MRVLIRAMKRIGEIVGQQGAKLRDRSRSVKFRILEIGRVARTKGGPNRERLQQGYEKLLSGFCCKYRVRRRLECGFGETATRWRRKWNG